MLLSTLRGDLGYFGWILYEVGIFSHFPVNLFLANQTPVNFLPEELIQLIF